MRDRQPFLHDLNVLLAAPLQAWSGQDGQIRGAGVQGIYCADTRVVDRAVLTVNGEEPEFIGMTSVTGASATFEAMVRTIGNQGNDPLVSLSRRRHVGTGRVSEIIVVRSDLSQETTAVIEIEIASDFSPMDSVKSGGPARPVTPEARGNDWLAVEGSVSSAISAPDALATLKDNRIRFRWDARIPARGSAQVGWSVEACDVLTPFTAAGTIAPATLRVSAQDPRLAALADRALADLEGLRMSPVDSPQDTFLAAGAPWFFTLFGRDSLISARMLLPVDPTLAAGTLRTLAARQGSKNNPETAEQPGKILHEVRRSELRVPADSNNTEVRLPPVYYGTVDATLLWINLLHDAWRWGMPEPEVRALLGNLEAAMEWLRDWADADGDGFLEYIDHTGHGLANQGWKDSGDSIRWSDGTLATGPIALAEVQGYVHQAATNAADLMEAFNRPGAEEWRSYARDLVRNFRNTFWCTDDIGPYPAIALDKDKRPVNGVASNMGHLLGTGILSREEEAIVAARITHPSMFSGFGIRTLDTGNGGYWPLRYHAGSVWTHDTAFIIDALAKAGHTDEAARIGAALLNAAEAFDYRLPELFSGHTPEQGGPLPYPASCRPQAWAAASVIPMMLATLQLTPQGPGSLPATAASVPTPFGPFTVEGLRTGDRTFTINVDQNGTPTITSA